MKAARNRLLVLLLIGGFLCGCASPPRVAMDSEIERNAELAAMAYRSGSMAKAASFYALALRRAELIDASNEMARTGYNLAVAVASTGNLEEAEGLLDESLDASGEAGETAADDFLLKAKLARTRGKPIESLHMAEAALKATEGQAESGSRVLAHLFIADVLLEMGQRAEAGTELAKVTPMLTGKLPLQTLAEAERARGRLMMADGKAAQAAARFDAEARLRKGAGKFREMALALRSAGEAYEKIGSSEAAADRYFRAARSLYAAGDEDGSQKAMEKALAVAKLLNDVGLRNRIMRFSKRLSPPSSMEE